MQVIKSLVLVAAAVFGLSACSAPATIVDSPDVAYVKSVIASHGIKTDKNIRIQVNDGPLNCGSKGSTNGVGGGCSGGIPGSNDVDLIVSPVYLHTPIGTHVILHEMGHISGIGDECGADDYAHAHGSDPTISVSNCHK